MNGRRTGAIASLADHHARAPAARAFADRRDAGRRLALLLERLRAERPVVLGMPRGGVPVAAEVARALDAPLDIVPVRKIGAPGNREFAIGAVAEEGVRLVDPRVSRALGLTDTDVRDLVAAAELELARQTKRYREGREPVDLRGRAAILVDDGLATGRSARAALRSLRRRGAVRTILAVPVAAAESARALSEEADEVLCAEIPEDLWAVGFWYEDFRPTSDEEVLAVLAATRARDDEGAFASAHTRALHAKALRELPFADREDFTDAGRGLIASPETLVIGDARGRVVWDMDGYAFVDPEDPSPDTVHPSLWRLAQLNGMHGLYEVVPGVYQVRGYDLSNVTFIEGRSGTIVVDPLISTECAAAALALYRTHRGQRQVSAVLYTHSHVDHFGGVKGVVAAERVAGGEVPIWAPSGFMAAAVGENVLAGTAMARRAGYMFAPGLRRGPRGQVDAGIGKSTSTGTITLIPPTDEVTVTGQEVEIDGLRFVFQLVPDSEAPAEMNFHLPELAALCVAENAVHCLHNVLTPRGAPVRDALAWSKYLDEAVELFADRTDAMFAQHHWPRWGKERIVAYLEQHRDMYRYLHDQTLRLANRGLTPTEIAAEVTLPPSLARSWWCRGYYGTVSHNVRAVYQRYLGFFDGNPSHLDPHPTVELARRYVALAGGMARLLAQARVAFEQGDYRWAAELCSHAVFAEPDRQEAVELNAACLEQLGYQAESAVWRNLYLVGAHELRHGPPPAPPPERRVASADVARSLSIEQLWDAMGVRLDGPRAWDLQLAIGWRFTDVGEEWTVRVQNGALSALPRLCADAQATVTLTRAAFDSILLGEGDGAELFASGQIAVVGDGAKLGELLGLLDEGDPSFAIVTS